MEPETRVVRLKRRGRVVLQDCDVYVGRKWNMGGWDLPQSKFANPFTVRQCGSAERAVERYRAYIQTRPDLLEALEELRGKTLGCWCYPGACHAQVLVELLNAKKDQKEARPPTPPSEK